MMTLDDKQGVWFVYDGDCPICTHAATALRIRQSCGPLHTLNARNSTGDPLLAEINRRGFDLDEGMVIYTRGEFYHGEAALTFIASHGRADNVFTALFKGLFWSDTLSRLLYPWMRGTRNWLLRRRRVGRIDNLDHKSKPIFQAVFGAHWHALPPVMRRRYGIRPYTGDVVTVCGELDVMCRPPMRWLSPLMRLLGQIPLYNETRVPATVRFAGDNNTRAFHFDRCFHFTRAGRYRFSSRMFRIGENEVVEMMKFGVGWRLRYAWDGEKVVLSHRGYVFRCLGHLIPLPLTVLLGEGYAEERPVDDTTFDIEAGIVHPWWGNFYAYKGRFKILN